MRKVKNNKKGVLMSITKDNKGFIFRSDTSKQTNNFSSFWDSSSDSGVDEFLGLDTEQPKGKDVVALAGYKRAIGNFVNIVTGESIPVTFNNNDEYTYNVIAQEVAEHFPQGVNYHRDFLPDIMITLTCIYMKCVTTQILSSI